MAEKPSQFENLLNQRGITVPAGQELPHILDQLSEHALRIEHFHEITQIMADHLGVLTERLVNLQQEIRNGFKANRERFDKLDDKTSDLSTELHHARNALEAVRTRMGVMPQPVFDIRKED